MSENNSSNGGVPWLSICAGIVAALIQHSQGEDWVVAVGAAFAGWILSIVSVLVSALIVGLIGLVSRHNGMAVFGCLPLVGTVLFTMFWPFYLMLACYFNWWVF